MVFRTSRRINKRPLSHVHVRCMDEARASLIVGEDKKGKSEKNKRRSRRKSRENKEKKTVPSNFLDDADDVADDDDDDADDDGRRRPMLSQKKRGKGRTCQWKRSSPAGPAEHDVGGSFWRSCSSCDTMNTWKRENVGVNW